LGQKAAHHGCAARSCQSSAKVESVPSTIGGRSQPLSLRSQPLWWQPRPSPRAAMRRTSGCSCSAWLVGRGTRGGRGPRGRRTGPRSGAPSAHRSR